MRFHNNRALFSASTKMAELILSNYTLLQLLPRFGITLGFGEASVGGVCREKGIDETLFLMVCNIYSFDDYTPNQEELTNVDVANLTKYLSLSHLYYRDQRIKILEERLYQIKEEGADAQHTLVVKFFNEYISEVINHFEYEDEYVFPYIMSLICGAPNRVLDIDKYEKNHDNIDDKLSDLKSIIIKYLPESYPSQDRIDILSDIFLFEDDLQMHTRLEERILIPLVKNIERGYDKQ